MARRKASSQVAKVRKNYYRPKPLAMEFEEDGCPKRLRIDYKYGIGLALRNSRVPVRYHEVCNFIRVHMPKICCYRTDSWENCVRGFLGRAKWVTVIDYVKEGQTRPVGYYQYKHVDGKDNWELKYPLGRYDPEIVLTYPELHEQLYYGRVGLPSVEEIEAANVKFMEARAKWFVVKEPRKRRASDQSDDEGEDYAPMAKRGRLAENQNQLEERDERAAKEIEYFEGQQFNDQYVQQYNGIRGQVPVEYENQYVVDRNMYQLQENVQLNGTYEQNIENQGQNLAPPAQVYGSYNQQNAIDGAYDEANWAPMTVNNGVRNFMMNDRNQQPNFQPGGQMFIGNGQNIQHNFRQGGRNERPVYRQMEYQPFQDLTNVSSGNYNNYQDFPVQGSSSQSNQYQVFDQGYFQPQENVTGSGIRQKAPEVENTNPSLVSLVFDFDALPLLEVSEADFFF